jgi:hypothetical protein
MTLAKSLLRAALATLPLLDEEARAPAFAALDSFIARPAPSTHLAAVRVLHELRANARRSKSRAALAVRSRDRGLEKLSQVASGLAQELAALENDPACGRRLESLATLLEAHQELTARVRRAERARQPFIERIRDQAESERRAPKRRTR